MLARKLLATVLFVGSSIALLHCGGGGDSKSGKGPLESDDTSKKKDSNNSDDSTSNPTPSPTPPPVSDAGTDGPPRSVDAGHDAAPPPPPPQSGVCQSLNQCCAQLDSLVDRIACVGAVFAHNENACLAAEALYCNNPDGIFGNSGGTNCKKLQKCCNTNEYIAGDVQCTDDAYNNDDTVCSDDLYFYQNDEWGDCQ